MWINRTDYLPLNIHARDGVASYRGRPLPYINGTAYLELDEVLEVMRVRIVYGEPNTPKYVDFAEAECDFPSDHLLAKVLLLVG